MSYLYENSNPERFQIFCQSLLVSEYPGLQCFPVGQPDGGRDAWHPDTRTVLQVKWRRTDEDESADWMIKALEAELPKIARLVARGAEKYVMVTNANGTSHLQVGRIDRVTEWMEANIEIPSTCLWRDDIDARFNRAPDALRFRFPELLTGLDGIEIALKSIYGPNRERQLRAIRAFVVSQFEKDRVVKFKQISLNDDLFALFVDIPMRITESLSKQLQRRSSNHYRNASGIHAAFEQLQPVHEDLDWISGNQVYNYSYPGTLRTRRGAGELLLSTFAQETEKYIILEGAPGQGKSTLAQFVCQVHRARFLNKHSFLRNLSKSYTSAGFRIPIKIDLRDLASFFSDVEESESRSVEQFLAQLIHVGSGNLSFDVDDLVDLMSLSPTLLFFDGLDEVADLDRRRRLIRSIEAALTRFNESGADVQVVVTSRPSIFGRKANFDSGRFLVMDLANIDPRLAFEYSGKWVAARGNLDADEGTEVLSILRDKMELPHIRELTRNPMQLAILLTLIHQVGYSLPDQRTDLYRRYLDLFLAREAEKAPAVKKHSAILQSFIQYLAWTLQSQAESAGSAGSISERELHEMAQTYLTSWQLPVDLADDLFGGGLERIFVLVQRVSGLYEFEVQPLREFFCARHLYETSPVGTYQYDQPHGDRAQRFEALARNPFWLNVCRFYAGSYESGEIGSLILSLRQLMASKDAALAIHARRVSISLLSDWVFSNKRSWQEELIRATFDKLGVELLANDAIHEGSYSFDESCGQEILATILFDRVTESDNREIGLDTILAANGGASFTLQFERLVSAASGAERTRLLTSMLRSGAADGVSPRRMFDLIGGDMPSQSARSARLSTFIQFMSRSIYKDEPLLQEVVVAALDGQLGSGSPSYNLVSVFADTLSHYPVGAVELYGYDDDELIPETVAHTIAGYSEPAVLLPQFGQELLARPDIAQRRRAQFEQNRDLVTLIEETWGSGWRVVDLLALRSAGEQTAFSVKHAINMFDDEVNCCDRARYARLKRGSTDWWMKQHESAGSDSRKLAFWCALAMCWTEPSVFNALQPTIESLIDRASEDELARLETAVLSASRVNQRRGREGWLPDLTTVSDRSASLIVRACRAAPKELARLARSRDLGDWASRVLVVSNLEADFAKISGDKALLRWLSAIGTQRRNGLPPTRKIIRQCRTAPLSRDACEVIALDTYLYPWDVVQRARDRVMADYSPQTLTTAASTGLWVFA